MEPVTPGQRRGRPHDDADDDRPTQATAIPHADALDDDELLVPGTMLNEYRVETMIGKGGMGVVYAAVHPLIGKRAAIKILKRELCREAFAVERFVDEARVVNQIGHPNIVDVFAFGQTPDGRSYFVMEWLKGETLHARIARGRVELDEIRDIIKPLTSALAAAHAQGVVHRDLKPENVFLFEVPGEPPRIKLLDFGIAKLASEDHRVERTAAGALVGTPQYIAPEQAKGHAVDARTDVYSLGAMVFELFTGRPPFVADNAMEMVAKHLMEPAPRPSTLVSMLPELDDLVVAMLAKQPEMRPSMVEVSAWFERTSMHDRTNVRVSRAPAPARRDTSEVAAPPVSRPVPLDDEPTHLTPPPQPSPVDPPVQARPSLASTPPEAPSRADTVADPDRPRSRPRGALIALVAGAFLVACAGAFWLVRWLRSDGAVASTHDPAPTAPIATTEPPHATEPAAAPDPTAAPAAAPDPTAAPAAAPDPTAAPAAAPDPTTAPAAAPEPTAVPANDARPAPSDKRQQTQVKAKAKVIERRRQRPEPAPAPPPRTVPDEKPQKHRLQLKITNAKDYEVFIDGRAQSATTEVLPGTHTVVICAKNMQTFTTTIEVKTDVVRMIALTPMGEKDLLVKGCARR